MLSLDDKTNLEIMQARKQLLRKLGEDSAETIAMLVAVEDRGGLSYEDMLTLLAS